MTPIANKFVQWEVPALETLRNRTRDLVQTS